MNILLIGNSLLLTIVRRLPLFLNQLPQKDVHVKLLYISSGRIDTYVKNFCVSLKHNILKKGGIENRIWEYKYGEDKWNESIMPDTTIMNVLREREWDVVITVGHTGHASEWLYDTFKNFYSDYFRMIRENTSAKIYWTWGFVPSSKKICPKYKGNYDYFYGRKYAVAKNEEEMYELLNSIDKKICDSNNVLPFKLRIAYEELVKAFPNERRLIYDNIHPDKGIGEYFCQCYFYNYFLKDIYGVNVSDLKYSYNASKYFYYNTIIPCISVNKETKKKSDDIVNTLKIEKEAE